MKLVQFGAGNIGRSFIGQLFSRAGWDVVFIDVNSALVARLNEKKAYTVVVKREGCPDERRVVGPVRAVNGLDAVSVAAEIAEADLVATSVGKAALHKIIPFISLGLAERRRRTPDRPIDIVIAENVRGADRLIHDGLVSELGTDYPLEALVGLVETSIGKMVPLMRAEDLEIDPLQIFAEEYEELIVDGKGFKGRRPDIAGIHPVDDIRAYVDRKLFVHNLGHAAAAYLAFAVTPDIPLLADALSTPGVEEGARSAMTEAAAALLLEYPAAFSHSALADHIDDLLRRFKNRALGDTLHRIGRDLYRKLDREDRLVGAMRLCARHGLPFDSVCAAYLAAVNFAAPDENGRLIGEDERFRAELLPKGIGTILREASHLDPADTTDECVIKTLLARSETCRTPVFFSRPR